MGFPLEPYPVRFFLGAMSTRDYRKTWCPLVFIARYQQRDLGEELSLLSMGQALLIF